MYVKYKFDIEGMHCPSCSYRLQKHLRKLNGVKQANVNLASASLLLECDPKLISIQEIKTEVSQMGYHLVSDINKENQRLYYERKIKRQILQNRLHGKELVIALIFFIPLLAIGLSPLFNYKLPESISYQNSPNQFALTELLLSIPILITGWRIIRNGWFQLLHWHPNVNSLVTLSITASMSYSLISTIVLMYEAQNQLSGTLYYLPACAILTMVMLGRYIEAKITNQSAQTLQQLTNLLPDKALVLRDGLETEITLQDIEVGNQIKVTPRTYIPVDGIVKQGNSMVEESVFSGKKTPILKSQDDKVMAGMFNQEGYLIVEVQKIGQETFLAEIIQLIEEGENSRPSISRLADKVSAWVIQGILILAFAAAGLWFIFNHSYLFSLNIFIAVLMIACPVAIGLAVPLPVLFASRCGSASGILIRRIVSFEHLIKPAQYVFNLSGTITKGTPILTDIIANQALSPSELLRLAASAEAQSDHPLALAILAEAREKGVPITLPDPFRILPGEGIEAVIDDTRIDIGNYRLMELIQVNNETLMQMSKICRDLSIQGKTAVMIAIDGVLQGILAVSDKPRAEAREVIEKLQQKGNEVVILTGEHWSTARYIAHEVGVETVYAEIQPANRARFIRKLQHEGKIVIMVGDGVNDAGALAQADAGIAIGSPDDIAADAADIVLLNKDLRLLLTVNKLAFKTVRNIKENLLFAFGYNLLMLPVAAGVLYLAGIHFLLDPIIAVAVMFLGSITVILNSLRLKRICK